MSGKSPSKQSLSKKSPSKRSPSSAVDEAWREFAERLTVRLSALPRDEFIEIARQDGNSRRLLISLTTRAAGRARAEIDDPALSWRDRTRWQAEHDLLCRLGWRFLTRPRVHVADAGRGSVDTLVALVIRTLRELWGQEHPAYVTVHDPSAPVPEALKPVDVPPTADAAAPVARRRHLTALPDAAPTTASAAPECVAVDLDTAPRYLLDRDDSHPEPVVAEALSAVGDHPQFLPTTLPDGFAISLIPVGPGQALEIARAVLSATLGHEVFVADGVIEVDTADPVPWRVFVADGPSLVLSATLTHRLTEPDVLTRLIVDGSADWPEVTIMVNNDHVYARRTLDAAVVHPNNVELALGTWRQFLADAAPEAMSRLNSGGLGAHDCAPLRGADAKGA